MGIREIREAQDKATIDQLLSAFNAAGQLVCDSTACCRTDRENLQESRQGTHLTAACKRPDKALNIALSSGCPGCALAARHLPPQPDGGQELSQHGGV